MKSIFYIINSHFWKSITGPFFAFGFPVIFIAILGTILGYDQVLGGILAIPIVTVSLTVLPTALFEFKSSSLLKRIGVTSIKPWMFMVAISVYYISVMIIATITTMCIGLLIFVGYWNSGKDIAQSVVPNRDGSSVAYTTLVAPSMKEIVAHVNWGSFIYANLMNILVSTTLGLLISSIAKSSLSIQGISIPILIISEFLAAQVLPIGMVKSIDALYYMSYICPFKYSTGLVIESWSGALSLDYNNIQWSPTEPTAVWNLTYIGSQNIFNINQEFYSFYDDYTTTSSTSGMLIFNQADKIVNLVMPIVLSSVFGAIALKKFKWSQRG